MDRIAIDRVGAGEDLVEQQTGVRGHPGETQLDSTAGRASRLRPPARWSAAAMGALAGGLMFVLTHEALGDDAHITMGYARNLAFHGQWGLIPGETANSATSPLNVWLIALGTFVTRQPAVGVGLVLMASLAAGAYWSAQLGRLLGLSRWFPAIVVALLATSPLLVSTVGLETYLGVALLIGFVRYGAEGRWLAAGVLAGLLVLTRPDYALLVVVITLVLAGLRRRLVRTAAVTVAVAAPWHLTSWVWLGSAIPDTFAFKTAEHDWHGTTFFTSPPVYAEMYPAAPLLLVIAPVVVGALCMVGWAVAATGTRHPVAPVVAAFGLAGLAHSGAMSVMGVPPYLWYYAPVVVGLTLCVAITAATPAPATVTWGATGVATGVAIAAAVVLLSGPLPWREPPLIGNYATAAEGATVGLAVGKIVPDGVAVRSPGEIGTLAYFCECRILDKFSHRGIAAEIIEQRRAMANPVMQQLLAWNYMHLDSVEQPPSPEWRLEFRGDPTVRKPADVRWWPASMSWHDPGQVVLMHK